MLAEREGFEPPVRLRALRISSAARSTTLPPLRAAPSRRIRLAHQIGAAINMTDVRAQGCRHPAILSTLSQGDRAGALDEIAVDFSHPIRPRTADDRRGPRSLDRVAHCGGTPSAARHSFCKTARRRG